MMDPETRQWIVTIASVILAPILTFFIALWRISRLGLTKDNMLIVNERSEFRKDQIERSKVQDARINALDQKVEEYRLTNNKLYGHVKYLEAIMKAKGIEFEEME